MRRTATRSALMGRLLGRKESNRDVKTIGEVDDSSLIRVVEDGI